MSQPFSSRLLAPALAASLVAAGSARGASLSVQDLYRWSGAFGLGAVSSDGSPAYVETDTPDDETRFVVRFYFNASAPGFGIAGPIVLFRALSGTDAEILKIVVQPGGGTGLEMVHTAATDTGTASTAAIPLVAGWHFVELDWSAASAMGADNGSLSSWLDNSPTAGLSGLDNDLSSISKARWGVVATGVAHTGTLRLDDFASRRTGPIGPVLPGSLDLDGDGAAEPLTDGVLLLRILFGFGGTTLTTGVVGGGCDWCVAVAILERMVALLPILDIDDNGSVGPLTDGVLVLRYLFGFRGAALITGAVGAGAQRSTAEAIEAYIAMLI